MNGRAISFGPFRLLAEQRILLEGDKPVRLGSRAFDILAALVERGGDVVGKEELMARAWPQTFVEEANLKIQVSALRRALGDGQGGNRYIVTVVGRGYNFVAPVRIDEPSRTLPPATVSPAAVHNLPLAVTRMIGREETVEALISRLSRERLVTIVGPGGIGKTTAALAVAERITSEYEHGVWLIDLASLGDARLVPSAVATVLNLQIPAEDPINGLVAAVRDSRMLLLLDSCEHVIDEVANLATALLSGAKGVDILATSREPLRVAGENEYRLGPLGSPLPSSKVSAAEAAAFPAVQLFVERVTAIVEDFALTDENAPLVVKICSGLDGLPLAIEFAAPRVAVLGIEGLAAHLDHNLRLLGTSRRVATTRHRTMRAVVDWSYGMLSEDEQRFFRALGIFAGGFTVEAAVAVAMDAATTGVDAIDRLADLVAKSLVVADVSGAKPRFRLLDTTRAYVVEKLDESGERERLARRRAEYYRKLFERAEGEAGARSAGEWLAEYACEIDNLRAALDWAFAPGGDGSIGVALTTAAVPLWMGRSLVGERGSRAKQALGALGTGETRNLREEMRLHDALGVSATEAGEMGAAFTKELDIAARLGDREYQLRALHGLYFYHSGSGRYRDALQSAQRFHDLAANQNAQLLGERMVGAAKHFLGDQISARRHLEKALAHYAATEQERDVTRFGTDLRISLLGFLARVLWMQGLADQAMQTAEASVGEAQGIGHATSLCYALALAACPIALWVGNQTAAAHYTRILTDQSRQHGLSLLSTFASRFQRVIALKGGDLDTGSRPLREIVDPNASFGVLTGLTEQAEALGHAGRIGEGLALLEAGIEQCETGWLTPELLRLKGELLLLQSTPAAVETIEGLFRQALDESRRQDALSWQLRAATSLARLLRDQGRWAEAIACLRPIYDRFTEGFGTADLVAAKQLLDEADDLGNIP
ncbi:MULTISPECIES: winged helix-turn-helix domain-containing protein [unclassified Bradyrhizobium]|uniref:ATP-binding protein n=1 Tax=unclassified Bradyrhizobium TaxID=2631580 RepID=UPI001BDEDD21|nr:MULTISPECIES: winged helix-turn-helix domain-containing protein [unclassified Bradyrhizobium]MBT1514069.1 winged helix-turn-helix domain-containing protein [Bradyrhizobium sp. SRL28]UPK07171.1 winged helix-turn-helix domain-containing protein [Bradyrhizobium sp. 170]